jgi:hypothetical protein
MPGPVSDSYDPEFGTAENAMMVHDAVHYVRDLLGIAIGSEARLPVVDMARSELLEENPASPALTVVFTERQLRIMRFALDRALESL